MMNEALTRIFRRLQVVQPFDFPGIPAMLIQILGCLCSVEVLFNIPSARIYTSWLQSPLSYSTSNDYTSPSYITMGSQLKDER